MNKEPVTVFHPSLAEITEDTSAALLLQQIIYWWNDAKSQPKDKRDELIHVTWGLRKSAKDIKEFFKWKRSEYDRANSVLENLNFITTNAKGAPCTTHYLLHIEEIKKQLSVCGFPANWIADIVQTGLRESSKPVSVYTANSNGNKDESKEKKQQEAGGVPGLIKGTPEKKKSPPPLPNNFGKGKPKGFANLKR